MANGGLKVLKENALAFVRGWESEGTDGGLRCGFPSLFGFCFVGKPPAFV